MPNTQNVRRRGRVIRAILSTPPDEVEVPLEPIPEENRPGVGLTDEVITHTLNEMTTDQLRQRWEAQMRDNAYRTIMYGTRTARFDDRNLQTINDPLDEQILMKEDKVRIGDKLYDPKDCIVIDGNFYLKDDPGITTDIFTGELFHKDRCNVVIESLNIVDDKVKTVKTCISRKSLEYCYRILSNKYKFDFYITDLNNIKNWDFIENPRSSVFVDAAEKVEKIKNTKGYLPFKNVASKNPLLKGKIGDKSQTYLITEGLKYTFGVELEVNRGNILMQTAARGLNISCVRDGSINGGDGGPEYVTGVLTGDNGITHLQKICNELSSRTTVDKSCGVHLHLGNIDFTKKFLVNSYILAYYLQKEIFQTLPRSRRKNEYCKELPNLKFRLSIGNTIEDQIALEEDYNALFKYISADKLEHPTFEYNKSRQHPAGAKCGYNHNTPRYCWLNYVPAMFDTRGNKSYSLDFWRAI